MPELPAVISTNLVIHTVAEECLILWKKTTANTMITLIFFGPVALVYSSEKIFTEN